jgi:imidazolonepropionase-like amidohydrolase
MKRAVLCCLVAFALKAGLALAAKAPKTLVLAHVSVVDVAAGALLPDRAVEIRGGRIAAVSPAAGYRPPAGARVLDLPGRFVAPGFVEMHAHVLSHPWDADGNLLPRWDREATLQMLRTMLAWGITTFRDPGDPTEEAVMLRGLLAKGTATGPAMLTAGRIINASEFNPEPFMPVKTAEDVRREIRWQAAAGVDFVKVYGSTPPELVRVTVEEAHAHGLRVIGHLQRTTWTQAAELGIDAVSHASSWAPEYLPEKDREAYPQTVFGRVYWLKHLDLDHPAVKEMVAVLARRGVAVDPTLIAMHSKFWGNDPRYLKHPLMGQAPEAFARGWPKGSFTSSWKDEEYRQAQAQWPKLLAWTKRMYDGGVLLTVGTDTPTPWIIPGVSFHEELQLLKDAGIPEKGLLRMATVNAARALGREKEIGAVRPGMRADLVVLRANPLEDIRNAREIEHVVHDGNLFDPRELGAGRGAGEGARDR